MNDKHLERLRAHDRTIDDLRTCSKEALAQYIRLIRVRYRNGGYLEDALREYRKLADYFDGAFDSDKRLSRRSLALIQYELGYIENMKGRYSDARTCFRQSHNNALMDDDFVGAEIAAFMMAVMDVFSETVDTRSAFQIMDSVLDRMAVLCTKQPGSVLCASWMTAIHKRMLLVAVDMGDPAEAEFRYERLMEDPQVKINCRNSDTDNGRWLTVVRSCEARLLYARMDYEAALSKFATFLDLDLQRWGASNALLVEWSTKLQELAGDYLYAGLGLLALGEADAANVAFRRGMELNPDNANHYYQGLIERRLGRS